jgi:hypothetical protein
MPILMRLSWKNSTISIDGNPAWITQMKYSLQRFKIFGVTIIICLEPFLWLRDSGRRVITRNLVCACPTLAAAQTFVASDPVKTAYRIAREIQAPIPRLPTPGLQVGGLNVE